MGVGAAARALPVACHMPIGGDDSRKRADRLPARPRGGVESTVPERFRVEMEVRPADPGASVDLRASAPLSPGVAIAASCSYRLGCIFFVEEPELQSRVLLSMRVIL